MSVNIKVYNQTGDEIKSLALSEEIFGIELNEDLVHQASTAQFGNSRQVLAHTKGRADVRGGGKKPWKQKGTGRARVGSSRSPIWVGGGVTFGPQKDRNFGKKINKKMKQKAVQMVISDKIRANNLVAIDQLTAEEYKTKKIDKIFKNIEKNFTDVNSKSKRSLLVVIDKKDEKIKKSGSNLQGVEIINLDNINIIDLLKFKRIVMTEQALKVLEKNYTK